MRYGLRSRGTTSSGENISEEKVAAAVKIQCCFIRFAAIKQYDLLKAAHRQRRITN